jgi:hypothetical protein
MLHATQRAARSRGDEREHKENATHLVRRSAFLVPAIACSSCQCASECFPAFWAHSNSISALLPYTSPPLHDNDAAFEVRRNPRAPALACSRSLFPSLPSSPCMHVDVRFRGSHHDLSNRKEGSEEGKVRDSPASDVTRGDTCAHCTDPRCSSNRRVGLQLGQLLQLERIRSCSGVQRSCVSPWYVRHGSLQRTRTGELEHSMHLHADRRCKWRSKIAIVVLALCGSRRTSIYTVME